jgi:hypothetical protein
MTALGLKERRIFPALVGTLLQHALHVGIDGSLRASSLSGEQVDI